MANALGRGLEALMGDAGLTAKQVSDEVQRSNSKLPNSIETREDGSLWVDPSLLKPNPKQPRIEFNQEKLQELAESIKENGILQPIIIEEAGNGEFYIIAGERRTRAARLAQLDKVPVQLRQFSEEKKLEVALIENIQRADLNPIEEAMAYYNLIQLGDLNQEEVAKRVGKSRSAVANAMRLLKLPEDIQHALVNGDISAGHAKALLMVKNDADMRVMFAKIVGNGLSVREAEKLADEYNDGGRAKRKEEKKKKNDKDADVLKFEQELRNKFGTRDVNFKGDINKGSIVIGFNSQDDFNRVYNTLLGLQDDN